MMNRRSWVFAGVALACMHVEASAQTTTATTPTSNPTFSQGTSGVGTGPGIGTTDSTGSFSGGTANAGGAGFSGGTTFAGGTGMTGGGATGRAGATTSTSVPTTYNPFRAAYVNPYAKGAGSTKTFGQPILATVSTTTAGGAAGARGAAGIRGAATSGLQGAGAESTGFSTVGIRRAPAYSSSLGRDIPVINIPQPVLRQQIQATMDNITLFPPKNGVQVSVEGSTVVLRGQVEDERERRVMEGIIRLTPGVREIRNELVTR